MRILAIADIHGAVPVYEWLIELAAKYEPNVVVLAGDLLSAGWEEEQREEARNIVIPLLKKISAPVLYIMGNDDNVALDHEDEQIRPLHGRRLSCANFSFVGYEITPPFVGSAFVKPEGEIEKDVRSLEPLLDPQTVLVTHAPAYGTLDQSFAGEHVGSLSLAARLQRSSPVLAHIHGHIHGCFGRERNHFNVAAAGRRRAVLIHLPTLDHHVLTSTSPLPENCSHLSARPNVFPELESERHMALTANALTQQLMGQPMSTMMNKIEISTLVSAKSRLGSRFHQKNSFVCGFSEGIGAWQRHPRSALGGLPPGRELWEHSTPPVFNATPLLTRSRVRLAELEPDAHGRLMEPKVEAIAKNDRVPKSLQFTKDDKSGPVLDHYELQLASEVQKASFPQQSPAIPGLTSSSFYEPARTVGGDYYDFLPLRDGTWGIAIGDVSGKGVGAALVMASLQASLRAQTLYARSKIEALMINVNNLVYKSSPEHFFASLFYAEYQPASRILKYVNAGHVPPIVLRRGLGRSEVISLNARCIPVGIFEDSQYSFEIFQLEIGDVLVAYTDGITESENPTGDQFGRERLESILCGCNGRDPHGILKHILDELSSHSAGSSQADDMTLLVMQVQTPVI